MGDEQRKDEVKEVEPGVKPPDPGSLASATRRKMSIPFRSSSPSVRSIVASECRSVMNDDGDAAAGMKIPKWQAIQLAEPASENDGRTVSHVQIDVIQIQRMLPQPVVYTIPLDQSAPDSSGKSSYRERYNGPGAA